MVVSVARSVFVIVVIATLVATVFRVATAPERMKARRDLARSVCQGSGGVWVQMGHDEVCQRSDSGNASAPSRT
jgi:hypothetical protein